jgi:hypothetical protein
MPGSRQIGDIVFDVHTLTYGFGFMMTGFQLLAFAVFTKVFAITEGLLPEDPWFNRFFQYVKLETGLVAGTLLVIVGIAGSIFSLSDWAHTSFGPLNSGIMLRVVLPSVFALVLGAQIIFSSFFLSILGLRRRR